jgi:hypothetical protein
LTAGKTEAVIKLFVTNQAQGVDGKKDNLAEAERRDLQKIQRHLNQRRNQLRDLTRFAFVQEPIQLFESNSEADQGTLVSTYCPGSNIVTNLFSPDKSTINEDFVRYGLKDEYIVELIDCLKTLSKKRIDLKDTGRIQNTNYHEGRLYLFDFIGTVDTEKTKKRINLGVNQPFTRCLYVLMSSTLLFESENAFYTEIHRANIEQKASVNPSI